MEDKIVINELLQDEEKPSSDNTVSFFFFIYICDVSYCLFSCKLLKTVVAIMHNTLKILILQKKFKKND